VVHFYLAHESVKIYAVACVHGVLLFQIVAVNKNNIIIHITDSPNISLTCLFNFPILRREKEATALFLKTKFTRIMGQ